MSTESSQARASWKRRWCEQDVLLNQVSEKTKLDFEQTFMFFETVRTAARSSTG